MSSLSLPQWDVDVPTLESVSHTYTQYLSRNTFFFIISAFNRLSFYYFSGCWSNFVISLSLSLSHHLSSGLFTLPHKCFVIRQTGSNKFERARSSEQNVFSRTTPYTVYSVYYTQTHTSLGYCRWLLWSFAWLVHFHHRHIRRILTLWLTQSSTDRCRLDSVKGKVSFFVPYLSPQDNHSTSISFYHSLFNH